MNYKIVSGYFMVLFMLGSLVFGYSYYTQTMQANIYTTPRTPPQSTTPPTVTASQEAASTAVIQPAVEPIQSPPAPAEIDREQIRSIVKEVIEQNPELVAQSLHNYHKQQYRDRMAQMQQRIREKLTVLENNIDDPRAGNPDARIKIVEFLDYNCMYCKSMAAVKQRVLEQHPDIEYVFKDIPLLGEPSTLKARAALAANAIAKDKFFAFHHKLLEAREANNIGAIKELAATVGIDPEALEQTMQDKKWDDTIYANRALAREIGVRGTPVFIIAGEMVQGMVDENTMNLKINEARQRFNLPAPTVAQPIEEAPTVENDDTHVQS